MKTRNITLTSILTITAATQVCASFQSKVPHPLKGHHCSEYSKQSSFTSPQKFLLPPTSVGPRKTATRIFQSKVDEKSTKSKAKGVYSRPSAAIEKGSGFFVPGLEGSKVRILIGALLLVLNYINHIYSGGSDVSEVTGFVFSEKIATFYGTFLLFQGIIEFAKEIGLGFDGIQSISTTELQTDTSNPNSSILGGNQELGLQQFMSPALSERSADVAETVSWVAASYLSLTPATHVILIEKNGESLKINNNGILYHLGEFNNLKNMSDENIQSSTMAAIDTVYQSKGGRVSIPSNHPAASLLPEENRRCVLLQQISTANNSNNQYGTEQQMCLLVGCDQLLATFTKNDLKWLGSLGEYLSIKLDA